MSSASLQNKVTHGSSLVPLWQGPGVGWDAVGRCRVVSPVSQCQSESPVPKPSCPCGLLQEIGWGAGNRGCGEACGPRPAEGPGHQPFLAPEFLISINIYFLPPSPSRLPAQRSFREVGLGLCLKINRWRDRQTHRQTDITGGRGCQAEGSSLPRQRKSGGDPGPFITHPPACLGLELLKRTRWQCGPSPWHH